MTLCHKMLNIEIRKHFITNKLLVYIHVTLKKDPRNFYEFLKLYPWMIREFGHIFKNPLWNVVFLPMN